MYHNSVPLNSKDPVYISNPYERFFLPFLSFVYQKQHKPTIGNTPTFRIL